MGDRIGVSCRWAVLARLFGPLPRRLTLFPLACLIFVTLTLGPGLATQRAQAQTNFKLLHTFGVVPGDGIAPGGGLIRAGGSLYGTTAAGGTGGNYGGTVFKVDSKGKETILYNFRSGSDGIGPLAGVVRDTAGNVL